MSDFRTVLSRNWRNNTLFSVLIELTYRCNLDCFFCYNDTGRRDRHLSTPQYLDLLSDLYDMQVMNLIFTGGEPLAHPDFLTLGRCARELGFVVRIKSNGHALRGSLARRIKRDIDPFVVDMSLHGASAATHDRQTRVPGSHKRLVDNIAELKQLGYRLKLNATLTKWNEHEMGEMFALADHLGVRLEFNPTVSPRDDGDREPLSIAPSIDGRKRLAALLRERSRRVRAAESGSRTSNASTQMPDTGGKHCGAGSSGIAIDPFGDVLPCVEWRRPIGSLHERSIQDIWAAEEAWRGVRDENQAVKSELERKYGDSARMLGFCPGIAHSLHDNPRHVYASARQQREAALSVNSGENGES